MLRIGVIISRTAAIGRLCLPRKRERERSPVQSVANLAGFFQELVDQRLTDAARDVLVDRIYRLAHRGVLLRRQRDDLGLAGLLDLGKRVLVFLCRLAVAESGGF